jgi:hypothetical protein
MRVGFASKNELHGTANRPELLFTAEGSTPTSIWQFWWIVVYQLFVVTGEQG